jgi:hypothetical protein
MFSPSYSVPGNTWPPEAEGKPASFTSAVSTRQILSCGVKTHGHGQDIPGLGRPGQEIVVVYGAVVRPLRAKKTQERSDP